MIRRMLATAANAASRSLVSKMDAAEGHLDAALELLEKGTITHAQALGHRSLCHLLRATAAREDSCSDDVERTRVLPPHSETVHALRCAAQSASRARALAR